MLNLKPPVEHINRGEFKLKKGTGGGGAPVAGQSLRQEDQLI
jgi:hypothetical protein